MASLKKAITSLAKQSISGKVADVKDKLKKEFLPNFSGLRNLPIVGGLLDQLETQHYQEQAEKEEAEQERRKYEAKQRAHAIPETKANFTGSATSYQTLVKTLETISERVADAVKAAEEELKLSGLSRAEQVDIMKELRRQLKTDGEVLKLKLTELASSNQLTNGKIAQLVEEMFPSMIDQMHTELEDHRKTVREHLQQQTGTPVETSQSNLNAAAEGKETSTGSTPKTIIGMLTKIFGVFSSSLRKIITPFLARGAATAAGGGVVAGGLMARAAGALGTASMIGGGALAAGALLMPRWAKGVATGITHGVMKGIGMPGADATADILETVLEIGEHVKTFVKDAVPVIISALQEMWKYLKIVGGWIEQIWLWIKRKFGTGDYNSSTGPTTTEARNTLEQAEKKMDLSKPDGALNPENINIKRKEAENLVRKQTNPNNAPGVIAGKTEAKLANIAHAEIDRVVGPLLDSKKPEDRQKAKEYLESYIKAHGGENTPEGRVAAYKLDFHGLSDKNPAPVHSVTGQVTPAPSGDRDLGWLSRQEEGGRKGVAAVGHNAADGRAYGEHQLSARIDPKTQSSPMADYLNKEGAAFKDTLDPAKAGTAEFEEAYKKEATGPRAERLQQTQREYITRTHYEPVRQIADKLGFDTTNPQIKEALFSSAVQSGLKGNQEILEKAAKELGSGNKSIKEQLEAIYKARTSYFENLRDTHKDPGVRTAVGQVLAGGRLKKEERILIQAATQQQNKLAPGLGAPVQGTKPDAHPLLPNNIVTPQSKLQGEKGAGTPVPAPSIMFQQPAQQQSGIPSTVLPSGSGNRLSGVPSPVAPRDGLEYRLLFQSASPVAR